MKIEIRFPFIVRQATQVASAVAKELLPARPILLSISKPEREDTVTFRFEGGLVVRIFLHNMQGGIEPWRRGPISEDWVVWKAEVRRYPEDGNRTEKAEEVWDATRLAELKTRRPWWHPRVVTWEEIETYC